MAKEDRKSVTVAKRSLEKLEVRRVARFEKLHRRSPTLFERLEMMADVPAKPEMLDRFDALQDEWRAMAADGPPSVDELRAFLSRYVPVYNAVYRGQGKALCRDCGALLFYAGNKPAEFCDEKCAARNRQPTAEEREARQRQRMQRAAAHMKNCLDCKRLREPCDEAVTIAPALRDHGDAAGKRGDVLNRRDHGAGALERAEREQWDACEET
jgi:hypothetical protein